MSLVLDVNGLSIRMAHSLRKTPTCEGRGGRFLFFRDSWSTRSYQPETELRAQVTAGSRCGAGSCRPSGPDACRRESRLVRPAPDRCRQ
jgi:hypothetical protein